MKEVIFHFFTSVRFLGLGLKILFHKNKEIKRMLSKKMAFSLMSLIVHYLHLLSWHRLRWQVNLAWHLTRLVI